MSNKLIKFELPAGAIIGGYRHAGGGVFLADIMPKKVPFAERAKIIIEGLLPPDVEWPTKVHTEIVDDPLASCETVRREICFITPQRDGVPVHETEWPDLIGLSHDEYESRRAEWHKETKNKIDEARDIIARETPPSADQCCGKCEKPEAVEDGKDRTFELFEEIAHQRSIIQDLAHRLQTADAVIISLVQAAGGEVTITGADTEKVIGHEIAYEVSEDRTTFTFRAVPVPEQVAQ